MANTYVQIGSTVTVGSGGASSIDFTSIPATYTDLVIKLSSRTSDTTGNDSSAIALQFNGDTTSSYQRRTLYGDGGAVGSTNASTTEMRIGFTDTNGNTANTFGNCEIYIPNYAGSTYKSVSVDAVTEANVAQFIYAALVAGLWSNTAAITSIKLYAPSYNFVQHSTASLYGIKKN
jgi:hypothetical protein